MGILSDNFKNHPIHQEIETTLRYIDKRKKDEGLTDEEKDSLDSYEQLLLYAKYVIENNVTQTLPSQLLTNLSNNVINLRNNNALNIETTYNLYTAITTDLSKIPVYTDKNIVKSGIGKIIENFNASKENIATSINSEIDRFKEKQKEEFESWTKEKSDYKEQLVELKEENKELKRSLAELNKKLLSEQEKIDTLITNLKEKYDAKVEDLKNTFTNNEENRKNIFEDSQNKSKEATDELLNYMQTRKENVEELWGIIGKAAVSGSSQKYANNAKIFAHTMMVISLLLMLCIISFLGYCFYKDISSTNFNPLNLLYRIPLSFTLFLPAWYCASIANRQRNREFQLRDFEIKTAGLEPFIENMRMVRYNDPKEDKNKKDETKLELVKDIFQNDLNKKKIDDSSIIIPKDIVEILKSCLDTWGKIKGK